MTAGWYAEWKTVPILQGLHPPIPKRLGPFDSAEEAVAAARKKTYLELTVFHVDRVARLQVTVVVEDAAP